MATKEEDIKDLLAAMKSKKNPDPGMMPQKSSASGKDEGMTPQKSSNDTGPFGPTKKPSNPYQMKSGGKVSSASSRADGVAQRGKTKGRMC